MKGTIPNVRELKNSLLTKCKLETVVRDKTVRKRSESDALYIALAKIIFQASMSLDETVCQPSVCE